MAYEKLAIMANKETGERYLTAKNKKKLVGIKLKQNKYSKKLRKVVVFNEVKK